MSAFLFLLVFFLSLSHLFRFSHCLTAVHDDLQATAVNEAFSTLGARVMFKAKPTTRSRIVDLSSVEFGSIHCSDSTELAVDLRTPAQRINLINAQVPDNLVLKAGSIVRIPVNDGYHHCDSLASSGVRYVYRKLTSDFDVSTLTDQGQARRQNLIYERSTNPMDSNPFGKPLTRTDAVFQVPAGSTFRDSTSLLVDPNRVSSNPELNTPRDSTVRFSAATPRLEDLYDEIDFKFHSNTIDPQELAKVTRNRIIRNQLAPTVPEPVNRSPSRFNPSNVAQAEVNSEGDSDSESGSQAKDGIEEWGEEENQAELNGANPGDNFQTDIGLFSGSIDGQISTPFGGWNYNRRSGRADTSVIDLIKRKNPNDLNLNCTGCFASISIGMRIELSWSVRHSAKNHFAAQFYATGDTAFNFGIASIPLSKKLWSTTIQLPELNIMKNVYLFSIGPIPIFAKADISPTVPIALSIGGKVDMQIVGGGRYEMVAGIGAFNNEPKVPNPDKRFHAAVNNIALRPSEIKGSIAFHMGLKVTLDELVSLTAFIGPKMEIKNEISTSVPVCRLTDPKYSQVPALSAQQFSLDMFIAWGVRAAAFEMKILGWKVKGIGYTLNFNPLFLTHLLQICYPMAEWEKKIARIPVPTTLPRRSTNRGTAAGAASRAPAARRRSAGTESTEGFLDEQMEYDSASPFSQLPSVVYPFETRRARKTIAVQVQVDA